MKNKKIALVLSLLFPGLGHLYLNRFREATEYIFCTLLLFFGIFLRREILFNPYGSTPFVYIFWAAGFFLYSLAFVSIIRTGNKETRLQKIINVVIAVPLALALIFAVFWLPKEIEYQKDHARFAATTKIKLPKEPLPEVKYPILGYRIPGLGGFCWLESSSGLIKYLEPDIDFDTFVFYGRPTLIMAGRNNEERWGPGLNQIHSFTELGYTAFRGSTNLIHPSQNIYPDVNQKNFIYFRNVKEELEFIKRLVSAGIIPTIGYKGDFSTVIGYDRDGLWIIASAFAVSQVDQEGKNFMSTPLPYEAEHITHDQFFSTRGGENSFYWFEKTGTRKPEVEIYQENKKNAQEAAQNIKDVIDYLERTGNLLNFTYELDIPSSMALYRYFIKKGESNLANIYLEIAKMYESQRVSAGKDAKFSSDKKLFKEFIVETLVKVQPLYEQAATMW